MDIPDNDRLADSALRTFLDGLFPHGAAGHDVLAEIAPEGWERSPLLACFHPSVEQLLEEEVRSRRELDSLRAELRRDDTVKADDGPRRDPTLQDLRRRWKPRRVRANDELAELMGLCLWDVFSDSHVVVAADGRAADIGPFRKSSDFLDQYIGGESCSSGRRCFGFYFGTNTISKRADLTNVFAMIFRRLRSAGADWLYRGLAGFIVSHSDHEWAAMESLPEPASFSLKERGGPADAERLRAKFDDLVARVRERILNSPPPATVRGYRQVYGREPRGWPPV